MPAARTDRPPGLYRRAGVAEVVHRGAEPTPADLTGVREWAVPAALTIVLGPDVVPPPDHLLADTGPGGER